MIRYIRYPRTDYRSIVLFSTPVPELPVPVACSSPNAETVAVRFRRREWLGRSKILQKVDAAIGAELLQDVADVVLDGLVADGELGGDLGVGAALDEQGEDLLLLGGEGGLFGGGVSPGAGVVPLAQEPHLLPRAGLPYSLEKFVGTLSLVDEGVRPREPGGENLLPGVAGGEDDDARGVGHGFYLSAQFESAPLALEVEVQDHDIRGCFPDELESSLSTRGLAHGFHALFGIENSLDAYPYDGLLVYDENFQTESPGGRILPNLSSEEPGTILANSEYHITTQKLVHKRDI